MNLSPAVISKVNATFMAWGEYTTREHDETLVMSRTFEFANSGKKRKDAPPKARRYAKWIKTSQTRNRPGAIVINYKPTQSMALVCDVIEQNLGENYQLILVRKYIDGKKHDEIAKELGKHVNSVGNMFSDLYLYFSGILRINEKIG